MHGSSPWVLSWGLVVHLRARSPRDTHEIARSKSRHILLFRHGLRVFVMVTLGKKSQPRGCSKIAISSGFRIVDDISGSGGRKNGGVAI